MMPALCDVNLCDVNLKASRLMCVCVCEGGRDGREGGGRERGADTAQKTKSPHANVRKKAAVAASKPICLCGEPLSVAISLGNPGNAG